MHNGLMGKVTIMTAPQVVVVAELESSIVVLCDVAKEKYILNLVDLAFKKYCPGAVAVSFTRQWPNTASNSQRISCSVLADGQVKSQVVLAAVPLLHRRYYCQLTDIKICFSRACP